MFIQGKRTSIYFNSIHFIRWQIEWMENPIKLHFFLYFFLSKQNEATKNIFHLFKHERITLRSDPKKTFFLLWIGFWKKERMFYLQRRSKEKMTGIIVQIGWCNIIAQIKSDPNAQLDFAMILYANNHFVCCIHILVINCGTYTNIHHIQHRPFGYNKNLSIF